MLRVNFRAMKTTLITLLLLVSAFAPAAVGRDAMPTKSETTPNASPDFVECKIHRNYWPLYPTRLLHQGVIRGEASVMVEVGTNGAVTDQLLVSYTHPDFGAEAMHAVSRWTFDPGRNQGEPVVSVLRINFEFTVQGVVVYDRFFDAIKTEDYLANKYAYFPHGPETLDAKPAIVTSSPPVYPKSWIDLGHKGHVTLRFFIDETGRPRIPIVVGQSDTFLSSAAAAAIKDWRFQPPRSAGKPVLAYVEQVFVFEPALAKTDSS
jgi:TonB family protein